MTPVQTAFLTALALGLAFVFWWIWTRRREAEEQAETNAHLARLAVRMDAITHDLNHLVMLVADNLSVARELPAAELQVMVDEVEAAARSAAKLVSAVRVARTPGASCQSAEVMLRTAVGLLRRSGASIDMEVAGDFSYRGPDEDALRVIQNLLVNATREAGNFRSGRVLAVLTPGGLRVTNPVRDPSALTDAIYEPGVSLARSSGMGLAIAREQAERLGWRLRHEVEAGNVTFIIEPRPSGYRDP